MENINLYHLFFTGAGGTALGALLGAWFSYRFQKKLLGQQLDFQKTLQDQFLQFQKAQAADDKENREKIADLTLKEIKDAGERVKYAIGHASK